MVITVTKFEKAFLIHIYLQRVDEVVASSILSRFSTSEYFRAKRLFHFVLELSAETKWN